MPDLSTATPGGESAVVTAGVRLAEISELPLDPAAVDAAVRGPHHGAVVLFTGVVRDHDGGQAVSALEYSAHPAAARFLRECCASVAESSGLPVAAVHRIGDLDRKSTRQNSSHQEASRMPSSA